MSGNPTQEELIARLDEKRDYGPRGLEGVIAAVRSEELYLTEVPDFDIPAIRKTENNMAVKGTARISRNGSNSAGQRLTQLLIDYMEQDGGEEKMLSVVDETLNMESKHDIPWKSRVDMVAWVTERIAGRPADARPPVEDALIKQLLSRMQQGTLNEEREIPQLPEYTTIEVEG